MFKYTSEALDSLATWIKAVALNKAILEKHGSRVEMHRKLARDLIECENQAADLELSLKQLKTRIE